MSAPFVNDPGLSVGRLSYYYGRHEFWISVFILLIPYPFLLLHKYFNNGFYYFQLPLFVAGSLLEFVIDAYLVHAEHSGRNHKRRSDFLRYLNRIVVGLPFNVYLASAAVPSAIVILRMLPTMYLLGRSRKLSILIRYLVFFSGGYLLYTLLWNFDWPSPEQWGVLLLIIATVGLYILLQFYGLKNRLRTIHSLRDTRRVHRLGQKRGQDLHKLLTGLVGKNTATKILTGGYRVSPWQGTAIAIHLSILNLNDLQSKLLSGNQIDKAGLEIFQREWNIIEDQIRKHMHTIDADLGSWQSDSTIRMALPVQTGISNLALGLARVILLLWKIDALMRENRRLLLRRGLPGPVLRIYVASGEVFRLQIGSLNPACNLYGEVFDRMHAGVVGPEISGSIFISVDLKAVLEPGFQFENAASDWLVPVALHAEYARDDTGRNALPDFESRFRQRF